MSLKSAGMNLTMRRLRRVAAHQRVEIVLELPDLVGRPFLRQRRESVGRRAATLPQFVRKASARQSSFDNFLLLRAIELLSWDYEG